MLSTQPVESFRNLHARVAQLLSEQEKSPVSSSPQLALGLDQPRPLQKGVSTAANSVAEFLNLVSASVPDGDVYLFGGVLNWRTGNISYSYDVLCQSERKSYGNNKIELAHYQTFRSFAEIDVTDIHKRWEVATEIVSRQHELWMGDLIAV